jgi:uncharacterized repeat protein (TIGR02543 family)
MLAAVLATAALGAPPAVAAPGTTRTFGSGELCRSAGEVTYDAGAITIDLGVLPPETTEVVIPTGTVSCLREIISLNWTGTHPLDRLTIGDYAFSQNNVTNTLASVTFPAGLKELTIGTGAFYQQASDGGTGGPKGPNTLASVTFPEDLTSLSIGANAFYQYATSGNNALASVTFPASLTSLSIGAYAFHQDADVGGNALEKVDIRGRMKSLTIGDRAFFQTADTGNNALSSLSFPEGVETITLGTFAFGQRASHGATALASIRFPSGLKTLVVGENALWQYLPDSGTATLSVVRLPGSLTSLSVGAHAFQQAGMSHAMRVVIERTDPWTAPNSGVFSIDASAFSSVPTWYWFGADNTGFDKVWNGAFTAVPANPVLLGYRTLNLDAGAGTTPDTWYVYPVSHVITHYPQPQVLERAMFGAAWSVNLPSATRAGYQLDGWCSTAASPCPTTPAAVGASYSLSGASQTLYAAWTPLPPVVPNLPDATVGTLYEATVASGAELTCAVSGTLPPGLSLSGCRISGTPSVAGSYPLTVKATNAAGDPSVLRTLVVRNTMPTITTTSLPTGVVGTAYSAPIALGGTGTITCKISAGSLPSGIALQGCVLAGTPTGAGPSSFTVTASNDRASASRALTLVVHNRAPSIGAAAPPSGKVTVPYSHKLPVTGVAAICTVTAGSLPPGVALKSCALSGTPTKKGSYTFTVTASNDGGAASRKYTLTVAPAKKFTKMYAPTISGTAKVGKTLKAKVKTWKPKPAKLTWQWYRNGVAIAGATKTSYQLTKADKGKKLTVRVVGTRVGYLGSASSKKTAKVK